ncbi:MAG: lipid-A-disaccharide synthase [Vicinamibacterales bacterium]
MTHRLLLSCGEPSGDLYAGALTRELRASIPDLSIAGLGGPEFASAGGELIADYRGLAVTGLTEALSKVPQSLSTLRSLTAAARRDRPSALIVIDFPDFNLPLARRVKRLGIPVVYYIGPQVWAWRASRLKTIAAVASRVLVIFPFEEQVYREAGIPVEFVGHPLVEIARPSMPKPAFLHRLGLDAGQPVVAVLPGSRPNEIGRLLPDLLSACRLIQARLPSVQFLLARAPNLDDQLFAASRDMTALRLVDGETDAVLASADVALTASGTATVQAALHDTPMVVVYRLSPLTYRLGRRLVRVNMFAMVNLIAGERIVPELIQDAFTPQAAAEEALSMLTNASRTSTIRAGLARVRQRLGGPGASRRAAAAIVQAAGWVPPAASRESA